MSRTMKLWVLASSTAAFLALLRPAFGDGKAIPGYKPSATKATPVATKKGSAAVVVRAPAKRYKPYKTYGFRTGPSVKYNHHHPIPSGGWCRMGGWHLHTYAPVVNPHWVVEGAGYIYMGIIPEVTVVAAPPPPVVYVETAPPPPPTVVYVSPAPAPAPTVIYLDDPDCRERVEYKKHGVKIEYKCKRHGKGKKKGHKKHKKHHDHDDDDHHGDD